MQDTTSQNLENWYKSLKRDSPLTKTGFIKIVARRCRVSGNTVVNWVNGLTRPSDEVYVDVLSEISGISKDDLFHYDN